MLMWLRRAWTWVSLALGLAVVALFSLWRRSAREAALERERADDAKASAAREREVADKVRAIEQRAEGRRAEIEARAEVAATTAEVAETGSAAAEVNRRIDIRAGRSPGNTGVTP